MISLNHMKTIQIVLLILIIIGVGLIFTQKYWVPPLIDFTLKQEKGEVVKNDPRNITTSISGREIKLVDGRAEMEITPGSSSKEVVEVFGEPVLGDLNGDGAEDAVMYLTQNSGGSGTFFYIVEAINDNGFYKGTNAMLLGDRIAPQNINIMEGRAVANFAERKAGEPMTAQPSVGKSVWVHYDAKNHEIGEWVKDFEGESGLIFCTEGQRNADFCTADYKPVCAEVQIQCIKAPCDPIQETFSNSCNACKNRLVKSYLLGECRK